MSSVAAFERSLSGALQNAAKVLERTRNPKLAGDVPHEYRDKFQLVESVVRASCAAFVGCLERLGVDDAVLRTLVAASAHSEVTLESRSRETCTFLRRTRAAADVVTCTDVVREAVLRRVHEVDVYHWRVEAEWQLCAVTGTARADALVLRSGTFAGDVTTASDRSPFPERVERDAAELPLTWLLRVLSRSPTELDGVFTVDRAAAACRTPRRNPDTEAAVGFLRAAAAWGDALAAYTDRLFQLDECANEDLDVCAVANVFMPALPLMEETTSSSSSSSSSSAGAGGSRRSGSEAWTGGALTASDTRRFVDESVRQLDETLARVAAWPAAGLVSAASGHLAVAAAYTARIGRAGTDGVDYVEGLLRRQLVEAVGREVASADFDAYMRHHTRRLFGAAHAPLPLCVPVRAAPGRHPEGAVSVESGGEAVEPAASLLVDGRACTRFALNASAEVCVRGRLHVHAHVLHRFCAEQEKASDVALRARARQFGGFIVLLGVVAEQGRFLPKHAMIVQNKDEYSIPLDVAEIPTQAEFRDAIASLSPEQQQFAKAYRGMQLEATLFGVCVVQIKPQLERVLNLPRDSLVQELELTQRLLRLFVEYNISPDLLAYQPPQAAAEAAEAGDQASDATPLRARVAAVRERVRVVTEMVADAKQEELAEAAAAAAVAEAQKEEDTRAAKARDREDQVRCIEWEMDYEMNRLERTRAKVSSCVGLLSCCATATAAPPSAGRGLGKRSGVNRKRAEELYDSTPYSVVRMCIDVDSLPAVAKTGAKHDAEGKARVQPAAAADGLGGDVCRLPGLMERALSSPVAGGACLRPTVVTAGNSWTKTTQASLVSAPKANVLEHSKQKEEQQRAFDLLDALTRSGLLAIDDADVHVLSVSTHCFEQTLIDTLVQGNVNPIEKVEVSLLLAAAAVYGVDADALLAADQRKRVGAHTPLLLAEAA